MRKRIAGLILALLAVVILDGCKVGTTTTTTTTVPVELAPNDGQPLTRYAPAGPAEDSADTLSALARCRADIPTTIAHCEVERHNGQLEVIGYPPTLPNDR